MNLTSWIILAGETRGIFDEGPNGGRNLLIAVVSIGIGYFWAKYNRYKKNKK